MRSYREMGPDPDVDLGPIDVGEPRDGGEKKPDPE
jgi:hypothetical protein